MRQQRDTWRLRRSIVPAITVMTATAIATPARAAELNYEIGYVGEYSTNIDAVSDDPQSEWIHALTGGMGYSQNTDKLRARVAGRLELRNYVHDVLEDDALYALDGAAVWSILPRRLTWTVEDVASQATLDPAEPATPANLAGANVFRTGPDLLFQLRPRHVLSLGARYMNAYVEDSDADNQSYSGSIRWHFESSPHTTWSLNAERRRVDFDVELVNRNYWRNDAYVQLEKRYPQSAISVSAGATRIEREDADGISSSTARMSWTRNISPDASVGISGNVGYEDTALGLISGVTPASEPLAPIRPSLLGTETITADVYYNRSAEAFYRLRTRRVEYSLVAGARERDFRVSDQDISEAGGRVTVSYAHSPITTFGLFADFVRTRHLDLARTDEDRTVGATIAYRIARNTRLGLEALRRERTSTAPGEEFIEERFLVSIIHSAGPISVFRGG